MVEKAHPHPASTGMHPARRLLVPMLALAMTLGLALGLGTAALTPATATAMTCDKATARPNEDGGDGILGGVATRLTWEGTVEEGEEVTSVTLALPEGSSFDDTSTRVTVLDGLTRVSVGSKAEPAGDKLTITFDEPIPSGSLLRLEVEGLTFPSAGGQIKVTGTYANATDSAAKLPESPVINVEANTPLQQMVMALDANPAVQAWNAIPFCGMFLKPQLLLTSFPSLFSGWLVCLAIVIIAYPFALLLGLIFALFKISHVTVLRGIASVYINFLRGTPLFLQIYIMFFGLPMLNINIDNNVLGVIVMAINSSAYLAEIFRAGIQSIPVGQYEAADSLGMSRMQTMFSIILPQTVRRVLPTITSDFITSYKDTSLLSSVGVMELMMFSKNLTTVSGNITPYVAAAIYYLIVTLPLIKFVGVIERRLANAERGGGPRPKGEAKDKPAELPADAPKLVGTTAHFEGAAEKGSALSGLLAPFTSHPSELAGGMSDAN